MSPVAENAPGVFFAKRFGVDERGLGTALASALERRADHADLFFEYTIEDSVVLEEGIVKSGDRHLTQGVGVRVQAGERQGYAHTDEISLESLRVAAAAARAISERPGEAAAVAVRAGAPAHDLYPVRRPPTDVPAAQKVALLEAIDAHARRLDPRVRQVMASLVCQQRTVLVAASDGTLAGDVRPLVRLNVQDPRRSRSECRESRGCSAACGCATGTGGGRSARTRPASG